jgi:hypothetical protein
VEISFRKPESSWGESRGGAAAATTVTAARRKGILKGTNSMDGT